MPLISFALTPFGGMPGASNWLESQFAKRIRPMRRLKSSLIWQALSEQSLRPPRSRSTSHTWAPAEGSDRTDLSLALFEKVSDEFPETGITLQARLHRTSTDLDRLIDRPGAIRLVKGAYLEPESVAFSRNSTATTTAYLEIAQKLMGSGHRVNLATHDAALVARLHDELGEELRQEHVEFEMLQGLGDDLLDSLRQQGFATREYIVYGPEWWRTSSTASQSTPSAQSKPSPILGSCSRHRLPSNLDRVANAER